MFVYVISRKGRAFAGADQAQKKLGPACCALAWGCAQPFCGALDVSSHLQGLVKLPAGSRAGVPSL